MKILKKLCAVVLSGCLFLCGSGFSNKYEDVQTIELKSNPSTGFVWNVEVINLEFPENDVKDDVESEEEKDDMEQKYIFKAGEVEISRDFRSDNEDPAVCGTGGTDIFTIMGKKEGMAVLAFKCKRYGNEECEGDDCDQKRAREVALVAVRVNEEKKIKIVWYVYIDVDELYEYMKSFVNIEEENNYCN